jgi:hypothetical protein
LDKRELFQKTWQTVVSCFLILVNNDLENLFFKKNNIVCKKQQVSGYDPEGRLIICDRLGKFSFKHFFENIQKMTFYLFEIVRKKKLKLFFFESIGAIKPSDLLDNFTVEELQMQHVQNQGFNN